MRKDKSKTINNINFTKTQLGFDEGIELLTTLGHFYKRYFCKNFFISYNNIALLNKSSIKALI